MLKLGTLLPNIPPIEQAPARVIHLRHIKTPTGGILFLHNPRQLEFSYNWHLKLAE